MPTASHETSKRPIAVDLFSGAGGLSLGFEQAGFDVAAAVELDPIHAAIHKRNFPLCSTICSSVADLAGDEIRRLSGIGDSKVSVVFGGPPCQGFSLIGKRSLDDPRNQLAIRFARIVSELRSDYFVMENVKGLTIGEHRKFLEEVIQTFKGEGYDVLEPYRILNAADYGVPQNRQRLFLIGCRKGLRLPTYPEKNGKAVVWDAIGDLPDADSFEELLHGDSVKTSFETTSSYAKRLRGMEADPNDYSHPRTYDSGILTSSARTIHSEASKARFEAVDQGKTDPISRFLKLDPNGLCNTLRAGTDSSRGAHTSPRPLHPFKPRVITVREAARLHSYPDWFRFHATKWHGFREIGNSVPPLLGRAVASEIIKAAGIVPIKPTKPISLDDSLVNISMSDATASFGLSESPISSRKKIAEN